MIDSDDLGRPVFGWLPGVSRDGFLTTPYRHEHQWEEQFNIDHLTNWWCRHPGCYASWLTTTKEDDHGTDSDHSRVDQGEASG